MVEEIRIPRSKVIPILEALFAVIVWGASFIATKIALRDVSPITVVWLRFAMGVLILGVAVAARRQFALPQRNEWLYFALLGFLGITFHQWLQSTALTTSRASTTAWIVATTPVFMALLGWMALREKLGWLQISGILLAALGVLLVVTDGNLESLSLGQFGQPGDILVLISSVNWAVFSVLSRRGLKSHPAARMMFYVMTLGWLFSSILFFSGPGLPEVPHLTMDGWLGVAFLGIFCSGLAYIAWYDALQALPAAQLGAFLYLEPPVAVVVAAVILAEALTWAALVGGAIILLGVWLVNRNQGKREMNRDLEKRSTPGASISNLKNGFRLEILSGGNSNYRLAQFDDYEKMRRGRFPHRSALSLGLHARASASSLPGTWGFGLWNDPFGLSLGFGGKPLRLPALPNAVWFFHASEENYLSFGDDPGNGFLAQTFRSPVFPLGRLIQVGLTFPFSRVKARQKMGKVVDGDGVRLDIDVTQWHGYRLEWGEKRCSFWVDEVLVLETPVSPRPPLGLVIWIDNQFAAWRPDGKIGFGLVECAEPAWLEVKDLELG